ncbi:MAG TPA: hypothetical protein DCX32_03145 [Candidatus Moranbacteria bacterium]|nr:MAG: hypothetical protein UW87_C0003G0020 [Candidatus Moranbacteria bacterium GW2011_GWC2_45_10]KKT95035.1 MAG: hypothetical protein UW95_C0005G0022 [Parcubacteria group bacterium GW2011_GWC1_45_14]HAV11515.1 hypothetical protein [Candidatus Moranbacteria bacterium]
MSKTVLIIQSAICHEDEIIVEYLASDRKSYLLTIPIEVFGPDKTFDRNAFISWSSKSTSPFKGDFRNIGLIISFANEMECFWNC